MSFFNSSDRYNQISFRLQENFEAISKGHLEAKAKAKRLYDKATGMSGGTSKEVIPRALEKLCCL